MSVKYIVRQEIDENDAIMLSQNAGISITLAKLLLTRGITTKEDVNKFLNPSSDDMCDPYSLYGMKGVVDRIKLAIERKETVLIYGDYDCDGLTATSILYTFLKTFIDNVSYYIPNRHVEGYGLHNIIIDDLSEKKNIDLIITVDCGVTSKNEVEFIKQKGIDVVITDHHEPIAEFIPDCPVLDPKIDRKGFYDFCGAGVALKLVEALSSRERALKYVALAALGTIADIVPLVGENRIIAKLGLDQINRGEIPSANIMIGKIGQEKITATDIMFKHAPRINALGRLRDATPIVEFFTTNDAEFVSKTADRLDAVNKQRQSLCEDVVDDILIKLRSYDLSSKRIIVLKDNKWNIGILGIAASKIAEMFNRPVILMTMTEEGFLRGSARSNGKVSIFDALSNTKDDLLTFGGHAQAAGVSCAPENFDNFAQHINEYIISHYDESCFYQTEVYDLRLDETIDYNTVAELEKLEPYGFGNPQPIFLLENAKLKFNHIGSSMHLKAYYKNIEIMAFNYAYRYYDVNSFSSYIITLQNKQYKSKKYTQGVVKSLYLENFTVTYGSEGVFALGYILSHLLYPKRNLIRPVNQCSIDDIKLSDNIFGNLIIAYTKEDYNAFLEKCKKDGVFINACVNLPVSSNPYNTLVLMPTTGFEYGYYKNIYFINPPVTETIYGCLQMITNANIYYINDKKAYTDVIRKIRCQNDDEYRDIYKKIIATNFFGAHDIKDMKIKLLELNSRDFFKIITTTYILFELGIIGMDEKDGFYQNVGIKNKLEFSEIYKFISEY